VTDSPIVTFEKDLFKIDNLDEEAVLLLPVTAEISLMM
jgi:hypothetical protein